MLMSYTKVTVEKGLLKVRIDHEIPDDVKVNHYLKNMEDLPAVDEVYATFFPAGTPARRTVGVFSFAGRCSNSDCCRCRKHGRYTSHRLAAASEQASGSTAGELTSLL